MHKLLILLLSHSISIKPSKRYLLNKKTSDLKAKICQDLCKNIVSIKLVIQCLLIVKVTAEHTRKEGQAVHPARIIT